MGSLIRSRKVQGQARGFEDLPKRNWGGAGSQINSRTQKQSDSKPLKSSLKYTYKAFLDSKLCLIVDLFLFTLNEERTRVAGCWGVFSTGLWRKPRIRVKKSSLTGRDHCHIKRRREWGKHPRVRIDFSLDQVGDGRIGSDEARNY